MRKKLVQSKSKVSYSVSLRNPPADAVCAGGVSELHFED